MRDPRRDQESAERYATMSDTDLIETAKVLNRRLIATALDLAGVYDEATARRAHDLAQELAAVRYELVRRRIPNPSGAVTVYQQGGGANIASTQTVGSASDSARVAGVEIGQ